MKAAPVIRALSACGRVQSLVHTGQHYDPTLSDIFFGQLGLPAPDVNLGVGSGSQAAQTAALLVGLERTFMTTRPAVAVVYGDVNSTLAGALAAAKLGIPVAHVEAGLRSFDRTMPEEINRLVTDLVADLCFATSPEAVTHLAREGVAPERIHFVGNPMIDTLLAALPRLDIAAARRRFGLPERYAVATVHRPANVDAPGDAHRLVGVMAELAAQVPTVLPLHPRGRASLEAAGLLAIDRLMVVEPLGYLEFMALVRGAALVLTDSGGIQEETTILGVPCLTIRPNTERPITITQGTNRLVAAGDVPGAVRHILSGSYVRPPKPPPLWDGHAGERIARILDGYLAA